MEDATGPSLGTAGRKERAMSQIRDDERCPRCGGFGWSRLHAYSCKGGATSDEGRDSGQEVRYAESLRDWSDADLLDEIEMWGTARYDELRPEILRRMSAGNPQDATAIIRAIIYAGDKCQGHRDCAHDVRPWQDARRYLALADAEPEAERSDGRIEGEEHPLDALVKRQAQQLQNALGRGEQSGYEECCGIAKCATHMRCVYEHEITPDCKAMERR